jgi:large subunit ribosomal protein L23
MVDILVKPIITEKMTQLGESLGHYGFVVNRNANKLQIKDAVEKMYGVTITSVRTMVMPGKMKTRNTKSGLIKGVQSAYKKAIVTVAEGEVIDFYSEI